MKGYLAIFALVAALSGGAGAVWYVMDLRADNAALTASVASLEREAAVAKDVAAQAKEARKVAAAEAERLRAKAKQFDEITEFIMRDQNNAPIPDILRTYLDRVFSRNPR